MPAAVRSRYEEVIEANQKVHTVLAKVYNSAEPQFRPENVAHVDRALQGIFRETGARRLLDLGCGTGFMIDIAKKYVEEIDGVDVTEAMLRQVDRTGPATIRTHLGDAGTFPVEAGTYDVVTSYSFLHHLYDVRPTLETAARALKPGGKYYVDEEPNYYFWDAIRNLDPQATYDPLVERERAAVLERDAQIRDQYQIDPDVFNQAEYGKNIAGGFVEEDLTKRLCAAGFRDVRFTYYWFLGQAAIVNDSRFPRDERLEMASICAETLTRGLPLTRHFFKYCGFVATR